MLKIDRNKIIDDTWVLEKVNDYPNCDSFECGDDDLNDYFHNDVKLHKNELLTQSYWLYDTSAPKLVLALLDFCNDAVQLKYYRDAVSIPPLKQYTSIPAVKLTRIGVNKKFHGKNIGTKTINMIKAFFISDNRTGCRLITVDAYNKPRVLNFYEKNGFKEFPKQQPPRPDEGTRALYFDLKRLSLYMSVQNGFSDRS